MTWINATHTHTYIHTERKSVPSKMKNACSNELNYTKILGLFNVYSARWNANTFVSYFVFGRSYFCCRWWWCCCLFRLFAVVVVNAIMNVADLLKNFLFANFILVWILLRCNNFTHTVRDLQMIKICTFLAYR